MAAVGLRACRVHLLLSARNEQTQRHHHQRDHHDPAEVLGERELPPESTQSTSPSSQTRFVEANWNASAQAALAPFWNRDLAIATAAYEHDEDAAPSRSPGHRRRTAAGKRPLDALARNPRLHDGVIAKPSTSAHQTSQAIRKLSAEPSPIVSSTELMRQYIPLGGNGMLFVMAHSQARLRRDEDQLIDATAKIEGQIRGIQTMVDEDRYCIDVLTQIAATEAALDKVALALLDEHARHCVIDAPADRREERTQELMAAVGRLMRRG